MTGWQDWQSQQEEEWGQWEAVEQIEHGGALAYDVGHPVPHSNVVAHGYEKQGLVRRVRRSGQSEPQVDSTSGAEAESE